MIINLFRVPLKVAEMMLQEQQAWLILTGCA
jgi:hypothetical protein